MKKYHLILLFLLTAVPARASEDLLYLEAQGIAGYSSARADDIYYSQSPYAAMQRSSVGFDYIRKLSTETREVGTAALQARFIYDDVDEEMKAQFYNAYLKAKTSTGDLWVGHNRIAFGLASYWDTHGELLQPLAMYGFGFGRDWGVGFSRDTKKGDIRAAFSSGSGMPLHARANRIATIRASYGVLNSDNYTVGLSLMGGETLDTMGDKVLDHDPKDIMLVGGDFAYNHLNYEHKIEVDIGEKNGKEAFGAFYRFSVNLLEENRLKLEIQPIYTKLEDVENHAIGSGASYRLTADMTARFMYEHNHNLDENRFVFQLYYYFAT